MDKLDFAPYSADFAPKTSIHSEAHALADDITQYFNEKQRYAMWLGIVKRVEKKHGLAKMYQYFAEIKQSDLDMKSRVRVLMWRCKQ